MRLQLADFAGMVIIETAQLFVEWMEKGVSILETIRPHDASTKARRELKDVEAHSTVGYATRYVSSGDAMLF